jgi:hypothetical protein
MPLRVRQSQGVTSSVLALPGAPSEVLVLKSKKPPHWVAWGILGGVVPREVGPQFCFYGNTPHLYDEVDCKLKPSPQQRF